MGISGKLTVDQKRPLRLGARMGKRRHPTWWLLMTVLSCAIASVIMGCEVQPTASVAPSGPEEEAPLSLRIVTTSNIVADWVHEVGGERVAVFALLPTGSDPHTFQPGGRDVARVADADLVITVGLGLEAEWLDKLLVNAAYTPERVVAIGEAVTLLESAAGADHDDAHGHEADEQGEEHHAADHNGAHEREADEQGEEHHATDHDDAHGHEADEQGEEHHAADHNGAHEHDHDHGLFDPHFWFDPQRVQQAVHALADQLSVLDPEGTEFYHTNAQVYSAALDELHHWIQDRVSVIPEDQRLLVTNHDSFQYFAQAYGFTVLGTVLPGMSTEREPSAQEIADLIDRIRATGVRAIFTETIAMDTLAQRIADEAGATVVNTLYTGSLGTVGGEAGTYLDYMNYNVGVIVEALKPSETQ